MAVIYNPITLPASKMLTTMTSLIGIVRFNDTLAPSEIINDLVDSSRIGKVDYGKGIVYTFKTSTLPVKDLTEDSSAFTITKPNLAQETILIDNYKFVPISLSEMLSKDAMLSGETINEFFSFVMGMTADTTQFHMFDVVNALYQGWNPGQATQTIQIDQINTNGLSGAELKVAEEWNAKQVAKIMRKTIRNMQLKNTKFTDVATFIDANDGEEKKVESCLARNDLKVVFNDKFYTDFLADAMSSLYHSEKVGEMIESGRQIVLPTDAMTRENGEVIAWASDRMKFAFADFYLVTLSIQDPSTGYTNTFYHFAYGAGVFKYAPGVKFVANYIIPAQA